MQEKNKKKCEAPASGERSFTSRAGSGLRQARGTQWKNSGRNQNRPSANEALADAFNRSIAFDARMFEEDITGSMAHAAMRLGWHPPAAECRQHHCWS
ncbi:MAG: hypothetical protein R2881_07120 [Eubacteriales bacterium]